MEYQELLAKNPGLAERISALPGRVFSGKAHPSAGAQAVFLCYALPGAERISSQSQPDTEVRWTEEAGPTKWYLFDVKTQRIEDDPAQIIELIRSYPNTERKCTMAQPTLSDIRGRIEKHIKNTYLKQVQAPIGVTPKLKAWMELS